MRTVHSLFKRPAELVKNVRDSQGHEHDRIGRFTGPGAANASATPKDSERPRQRTAGEIARAKPHDAAVAVKHPKLKPKGTAPARFSPRRLRRNAEAQVAKANDGIGPLQDRLSGIFGRENISGRVKALGSMMKKCSDERKNPSELWDSIGTRVTVDYALMQNAADEIRKNFKVIREKNFLETPGPMGYRGMHFNVVAENGVPAEIQLRTRWQTIWSDWCHKAYKPQESLNPEAVKRIMPLIERYAERMARYYNHKDIGVERRIQPPCTKIIRRLVGCLPAA